MRITVKELKKIIREVILLEGTLNIQTKEQLFNDIEKALAFAEEYKDKQGKDGFFTERQLIGALQDTLSRYIGDNTKYQEVMLGRSDQGSENTEE